ncbi:translation initiation factor IF-2 [Helicobacter sp. CLO-3]|uniref:translation initiation factor IF-2 n=1 Tax=unclassified Helicobacter TaxID=2593540 RepID=UPI00080482F5|nr:MULTISPECIES: translation initiation factor IF-2 [unclassified Helicobacter]OBV30128.1 translation initiation factor IF-2 [Helicobacter sp. CLO-3]OHU83528.1 translation initiation factor IF-2 [Helicobacter sp. CLO-3]
MEKVKIAEIAAEIARSTKEVFEKAKEMGLDVKNATSPVDIKTAEYLSEYVLTGINNMPKPEKKPAKSASKAKSSSKTSAKDAKKPESKSAKSASDEAESKKGAKTATKGSGKDSAKDAGKDATKDASKAKSSKKGDKENEAESSAKDSKSAQSDKANDAAKKATKDDKNAAKDSTKADSSKADSTKTDSAKSALKAKDSDKAESSAKASNQDSSAESKAESSQEFGGKKEVEIKRDSTLTQRSMGIRIVRKTNAQEEPEKPVAKKRQDYAPSIQEMMGQGLQDKETYQRKPKKQKKQIPATKHASGQKIDLLERNLESHSSEYDDDSDEIMLFDLNQHELIDEEKEAQERQIITDRVQIQRKNPWLNENRSISRSRRKRSSRPKEEASKVAKSAIVIPEEIRVYEFAEISGRPLTEVIKTLFGLGVMATKNDFLDKDAIEILADEFKIEISIQEQQEEVIEENIDEGDLRERAPVVTIMGHVDHGKTSLLDKIRDSRVASAEAGGITQHIGAYMVEKNGKLISFIDTPGHEAFSEMRSRGAQVTDIAIIVIAADDGVKPQTIEALNHAKAAGVQIIIAMNKIDKENANIDKLKSECAELGFLANDWGGEYEFIPVSAKTGEGLDLLLETILLQAEVMDLKAAPNASAQAVVLEGSVQKGRGPVASVIVRQGTLRVGDPIYAGTAFGRVRALSDDVGRSIDALLPSFVAQIAGLNEVPSAGSILYVAENDSIAREKAQKMATYLRQKELSKSTKVSFDELSEMVAKGQLKTLPLVVKADTQGSLEAIKSSLEKLSNDEVRINIIGFGVGGITEGDVSLGAASENCIILGFGLRPTGIVKSKAKELGVEIKTYSIIYDLIDDIKALVSGLMSPVVEEENSGQAEVRETFVVSKVGTIAGCMVTEGVIKRGIKVCLIRNGVVIHTGTIASLKRFKDDAKEVAKGYECGIMLENYNDIQVGDVFETFIEVQRRQTI